MASLPTLFHLAVCMSERRLNLRSCFAQAALPIFTNTIFSSLQSRPEKLGDFGALDVLAVSKALAGASRSRVVQLPAWGELNEGGKQRITLAIFNWQLAIAMAMIYFSGACAKTNHLTDSDGC